MVVYELVRWALAGLASTFGVGGLAIGVLAAAVVVLWYMHEFAGVLQVLARYSRTLAIVGFLVLVLLVAGSALGILDIEGASLFGQFGEVLH